MVKDRGRRGVGQTIRERARWDVICGRCEQPVPHQVFRGRADALRVCPRCLAQVAPSLVFVMRGLLGLWQRGE